MDQADDYDPMQDRYQISHKDVNRFQPDQGDMLLLTPSQGQRIPSVKQLIRYRVTIKFLRSLGKTGRNSQQRFSTR